MTEKTPREIKYGNDIFQEIITPVSNYTLKITYWDLWIAIILVNQFDNDLDKMINDLRSRGKKSLYLTCEFEGLQNHILLLDKTLAEENLRIADILATTDAEFIKKQKPRANKIILGIGINPQEKSLWMINTPRKLREYQAMRGHWHLFPVNPDKYSGLLESIYRPSGYSESQSFKLRDKLDKQLNNYTKKALIPELFALYRAFLTVAVEKMELVNDSCGVIGNLYREILEKYCLLDRNKLDMKPEYFFLDFIELLIWEDYGLTYCYQADFFKKLAPTEISLVKSILLQQKDELNKLELDYPAKNAQTMLKMIKR